jgi:DNA repair protein REV1
MQEKLHERSKRLLGHKFTGDENGDEYSASSFGGFGEYIANKIVKLQNQAKERIEAESKTGSQIFRGCVIYITGYTKPSLMELKHLITLHGGVHCAYMSGKTYATHIVAASLTARKREEYANYKVVKPEWIVDSIQEGRLLSWSNYRTIQPTSKQIPKFINVASTPPSRNKPPPTKRFIEVDLNVSEDAVKRVDQGADVAVTGQQAQRLLSGVDENELFSDEDDLNFNLGEKPIPVRNDPQQDCFEVKSYADGEPDDEPPSDGSPGGRTINKRGRFQRKKINCLDPDFIKTFYENSRLHHLSTWKGDLKRKYQTLANALNAKKQFVSSDHERVVLHVDFDAFFVSVSLLRHPDLIGKPVCVSYGGTGSGDIASCNYTARKSGVRNGMWMARGLELCPELQSVPYYFEDYERCSDVLYNTLVDLNPDLLYPVSIDEALVDVTSLVTETEEEMRVNHVKQICDNIRNSVRMNTGVEVSVGAGPNVLIAKVALAKAKPQGTLYIPAYAAHDSLSGVRIADIPGVGYYTAERVHRALGAETIEDIRRVPRAKLQDLLGNKNGLRMYENARGIDRTDISVVPGPKSVGVEICWGVRVSSDKELDQFVANLCTELHRRMMRDQLRGKLMSVKVYRRAPDAPLDPPKFMGCGKCDTYSKSYQFSRPTNDLPTITENAQIVVRGIGCPPLDFRGLGIQLKVAGNVESSTAQSRFQSRLTFTDNDSIKSEPMPPPKNTIDQKTNNHDAHVGDERRFPPKRRAAHSAMPTKRLKSAPETLTQHFQRAYADTIDENVLAELPTQIRQEIRSELLLHVERDSKPEGPVRDSNPDRKAELSEVYEPLEFRGVSDMSKICDMLQEWVGATIEDGPHYDDMIMFDEYIREVAAADMNWGKAVRYIEVLGNTLCTRDVFEAATEHRGKSDWLLLATEWKRVVSQLIRNRFGYEVTISGCCAKHSAIYRNSSDVFIV